MFLYRLLLTLLAPVVAALLALRLLRGRERAPDLRERIGLGGPPRGPGMPVLWLHGASNGELTSARSLIEALLLREPDLRIVVTSNSTTGRDMVRGWNLPRLHARLAPLDYRWCLSRFLGAHGPVAFVLLEGDLWPNRFAAVAARRIPTAIVSARISGRSFGVWRRFGGFARPMFAQVALLSAQDAVSEERYLCLGVPAHAVTDRLTLKSSVTLATPDDAALEPLRTVFPRSDTFLAASTHAGEEAQVIAAFRRARSARPGLRMILAPRHPPRGDEVAGLLAEAGLRTSRRSAGETPGPQTDVLLADTLGEMPLWYSLAEACFVGGSLVDKGGHTPFEPAQFGCAILHGPHLSNFAEAYGALEAVGGAIAVADAEALGTALATLTPSRAEALSGAARDALGLGATDRLSMLVTKLIALWRPR